MNGWCDICGSGAASLAITQHAYEVCLACFRALCERGVQWKARTKLAYFIEALKGSRHTNSTTCRKHRVPATIQVKRIRGRMYRYAVHRLRGRVMTCYLGRC